jgi:hypothetical protein
VDGVSDNARPSRGNGLAQQVWTLKERRGTRGCYW